MKTSLRKAATPRRLSAPRGNERRLVTHHARRRILSLAAGAVALPAVSRLAGAQTYPSRPITMIVPFAAGGPTDVFARIMAEAMKRSLGQPVIIENVSGADGTIGTGRAARAKPDGYTIDLGLKTTHVMVGAVYSLPYDVLNDFELVSPVVMAPFILFARKTMPANDLKELIAWLRGRTKPWRSRPRRKSDPRLSGRRLRSGAPTNPA